MSSSSHQRGRLPDEPPAAQAAAEARPLKPPSPDEEEAAAPAQAHQPAATAADDDVEMRITAEEAQQQPHRPPASSSTAAAASSNRIQQQPAAEQLNTSRRLMRYRRSPRSACYISGLTSVEVQSIMQLLSVKELLQLARCSRQMRRDADAPQVWRHRTPVVIDRDHVSAIPIMCEDTLLRHCPISLQRVLPWNSQRALLRHGNVQVLKLAYTAVDFQQIAEQIIQQPVSTVSAMNLHTLNPIARDDSAAVRSLMNRLLRLPRLTSLTTSVIFTRDLPHCIYDALPLAMHLTSLSLHDTEMSHMLQWMFTSRGPLFDHLRRLVISCCCPWIGNYPVPTELHRSLAHFRSLTHLTLIDASIAAALMPHLSTIQTLRKLKLVQSFPMSITTAYGFLLPAADVLSAALQANLNLTIEVQDTDPTAAARYASLAPRVTVEILES
jgi:hypothetical protein